MKSAVEAGRALYVPMRDGTRIAVDVWLPAEAVAGHRVGTVMRATRYWRAAVGSLDSTAHEGEVALVTGAGLALVTVDVRGTGASFGVWPGPWSLQEQSDLDDIVTWIAAQEWSNGRVGAHGVSYDGNTAELIGSLGRPAVIAVAPRFADYDPWAHLAFPGGVLLESFLTEWAAGNRALDLDAPELVAANDDEARELRAWFGHPKPVDGDDGSLVAAAVAEHVANVDLLDVVGRMEAYDDESSQVLGYPHSAPFARREQTEASGTEIRHVGSWYDAGTAAGVIARFMSTSNPQRAVIGAWSHGGQFDASPFRREPGLPAVPPVDEQRADLADWLEERLADDAAPMTGRVLTYVTVGTDEWRSTTVWPPIGVSAERLWLTADAALARVPASEGSVTYRVDPEASSGAGSNRWQTQAGQAPVHYADRVGADQRCVVWTAEPTDAPIVVTGSPVLHLTMSSTATDGAVHAYLEAVDPGGKVVYLTEGILRLLHRATGPAPYAVTGPYHPCTRALAAPMTPGKAETVELTLFPVSAHVPAGWRLRLALAGADAGTFRGVALDEPATWIVYTGAESSWIDLPVEVGA
ncbi:MAG: CocE/NonD family hydrolase [Actinomycetales bacterium]|nr:CocE/NonD family hydrolase [Actinomycetales bacterium]